jgi:sugar phosphate isomerase/epimerase
MMYRRSVITDEISQDLDVVLEVSRAFSLDGLEIRSIWDTRVDLLDPATVRDLRSAVDANRLAVVAVAPPFYKCDVDNPAERLEQLEILRRAIDVAQQLGTSLVRTFTFWRKYPLAEAWERLLDAYVEPLKIADSSGVTLAIENEYACHVGTGVELGRFVAALAHPRAAALWDPCNAFFDGAGEPPFPDGYNAVRGKIAHVHLKDATRSAGGSEPVLTALGEGEVDIAGQIAALVRDGYDGYISLETHWRPTRLDPAIARLPGGQAFSDQAAAATITCLKNWDAMMRKE